MPQEIYWESLFDVPLILDRLRIADSKGIVAELGCGYGTFTIPVARRTTENVHTFDIEPVMIERTQLRAAQAGLKNIHVELRDVLAHGFGLPGERRPGGRSCRCVRAGGRTKSGGPVPPLPADYL